MVQLEKPLTNRRYSIRSKYERSNQFKLNTIRIFYYSKNIFNLSSRTKTNIPMKELEKDIKINKLMDLLDASEKKISSKNLRIQSLEKQVKYYKMQYDRLKQQSKNIPSEILQTAANQTIVY